MFLAAVGGFFGVDFFRGGIVISAFLMYNVSKRNQRGGEGHREEAYFEKNKDNLHARTGELHKGNYICDGRRGNERCEA